MAPVSPVPSFTQIKYSITNDGNVFTLSCLVSRSLSKSNLCWQILGIAIVSLNRPHYRNPIGRTCTLELDKAFEVACADDSVKVIILRAEGDSFSSGHDLGTPEEKNDPVVQSLVAQGVRGEYEKWSYLDVDMCLKWRSLRKPLICAVKGVSIPLINVYVVYHGFAVMAIADIVIAADNVKLMPSLVEFTSLPHDLQLNVRKCKEIFFTQRFILADEAEELGIVNRVVPTGREDEEALALARVIAKSDPFQLRMMKLTANQALDAAGYSVSARSGLSHWTAYRASSNDPSSLSVQSGTKRFAPIKDSEKEDVMYWTRTASRKSSFKRKEAGSVAVSGVKGRL
ncbi:hypothetical protein HDU93_008871 [Gonapodya sp. JEL0774]|nr:hypothetical protein HDU93_008871 [Gonapodya sp. JEL0774]